jgi:hypothetical protein
VTGTTAPDGGTRVTVLCPTSPSAHKPIGGGGRSSKKSEYIYGSFPSNASGEVDFVNPVGWTVYFQSTGSDRTAYVICVPV